LKGLFELEFKFFYSDAVGFLFRLAAGLSAAGLTSAGLLELLVFVFFRLAVGGFPFVAVVAFFVWVPVFL